MTDTTCSCGHTGHWHGQTPGDARASGRCEHDADCKCGRFAQALPDHRATQAEGWRKVAVGDARAWKARAEKAEAENEELKARADESDHSACEAHAAVGKADRANGGPRRFCCPGCYREPGRWHPIACPYGTARSAYDPITGVECVPMRLVPDAERDRLRAEIEALKAHNPLTCELCHAEGFGAELVALRAENEALKASARVLAGEGSDFTKAVAAATHGDPPDRECLPGSNEKWEGYLLGVEEATAAAAGWIARRSSDEQGHTKTPENQECTDG